MDAEMWDHLQDCLDCRATWQTIPATRPLDSMHAIDITKWKAMRASEAEPDCAKCRELSDQTDYPLSVIVERVHT